MASSGISRTQTRNDCKTIAPKLKSCKDIETILKSESKGIVRKYSITHTGSSKKLIKYEEKPLEEKVRAQTLELQNKRKNCSSNELIRNIKKDVVEESSSFGRKNSMTNAIMILEKADEEITPIGNEPDNTSGFWGKFVSFINPF